MMNFMKLNHTRELDAYFASCRKHLSDTRLNRFLDRKVTGGNEAFLQIALKQAGAREFDGPKETWPSLFLSVDAFEQSPYHRNVTAKLNSLHSDRYATEVFAGGRLFNLSAVQPDPDRELMDWMKLRALDRDAETLILSDGELEWMLDSPSEAETNDPAAAKAHGNVLVFGLGIGYVVYMMLMNGKTDHITVVENDPRVIHAFREYLLPLFPSHSPVTILEADAFACWNHDFLAPYDYIYADIWQSGEDGLFCMERLLEAEIVDSAKADFWIETSCVVPLRTLFFLHYEELYGSAPQAVSEEYQSMMNKIRNYIASIDVTVSDPELLKQLMYDQNTLRSVLGGKICG